MNVGDKACDPGLTARDQRNLRSFKLFALPWFLSFLAVHLTLPRGDGGVADQPFWAWPLIAFATAMGFGMARAYVRFIRGADELMQKVHLRALATGFGVAFVYGMGADLLQQAGIPKAAMLTWALMLIAYSLSLRAGRRALYE